MNLNNLSRFRLSLLAEVN